MAFLARLDLVGQVKIVVRFGYMAKIAELVVWYFIRLHKTQLLCMSELALNFQKLQQPKRATIKSTHPQSANSVSHTITSKKTPNCIGVTDKFPSSSFCSLLVQTQVICLSYKQNTLRLMSNQILNFISLHTLLKHKS